MSVDYKSTLQLPETSFPMRAGLAKKEPEIIKFWEENRIYEKMLKNTKDHHSFIFHDGPPYANGAIHIGHALNKSLKDFIVKYKSMRGYFTPYVPGWDTHGLPIELKVLKDEHLNKDTSPALELRAHCHDYALKYVNLQREGMKRLGCFSLWDDPYLTLKPAFEARELETLASIVEKDLRESGQGAGFHIGFPVPVGGDNFPERRRGRRLAVGDNPVLLAGNRKEEDSRQEKEEMTQVALHGTKIVSRT